MNVYDFDQTVCYKDTTFEFWLYCLVRKPWILLCLPVQLIAVPLHLLHITKTGTLWWIYLRMINIDDAFIKRFADKHEKNMCQWYLNQKQPTDVIVSASPEFLIKEMCTRLGVNYIASQVDMKTGKYYKLSCKGKQKVIQFREKYPDAIIDSSYGNAESDQYIMNAGTHAYLVKNYSTTETDFQQWH